MGQYLATGLVTRMSWSKKEMAKGKLSDEEIWGKLENEGHYKKSLSDESETEEYVVYTLKNSIFEKELIPFLKQFLYQISEDSIDVSKLLESLENTPADKWLDIAVKKSFYCFQEDNYAEPEYLYFGTKDFRPRLSVNCDSIMLAAEGKIIMESYGRQFAFYKYCISKTFAEFYLASAIRIYITG